MKEFYKNAIEEIKGYLSNLNFMSKREIEFILFKGIKKRQAKKMLLQQLNEYEVALKQLI